MRFLKGFFSTYKYPCPDGTTRVVYRDIDKAFPLCIPGWQGKIENSLEAIKGAPVKIKAEYATKIQGLLFGLDELNQSLMMHFRGAYIVYQSNPCEYHEYLMTQVKIIIEEQSRLMNLRMQVRTLISVAESNPDSPEHVLPMFKQIIEQVGGSTIPEAAALEIAENRAIAKKWIGGDDER